jgi:hypothetical protein
VEVREDDDDFFTDVAQESGDELGQSYSVLMSSLAQAYEAMFPTHDHDHDGHHHHNHHAEYDGVNHHDHHGHDDEEHDDLGGHDHLTDNQDFESHEQEGSNEPAPAGKLSKNRTSWLRHYMPQNHAHSHHHHHHHGGLQHGGGHLGSGTWLAALASMVVISLMGVLAVCSLPLLHGSRLGG